MTASELSSKLPRYLLLAILVFGTVLRIICFDSDINRTPDEYTYTRQADLVLSQGVEGFHILGQELDQNLAAVSLHPSPLRVGYITLLTLWMRLTGDSSILAGAHLSILCSIATLILVAFFAYRNISPLAAIIATLFCTVFPFDLTISRRTWQESFITLLVVTMITLTAWITRANERRRLAGLISFALLGLLALTTKENAGIAFGLCAIGLALHFLLRHNRRAAILTGIITLGAVLVYVLILSLLFGGVTHSLFLVRSYAYYSGIGSYTFQFESGTPWLYFEGFFLASPFLVVAGLAGTAASIYPLLRARSLARASLPFGLALLTAAMLLIQIATQRYNFRFTAPIYGVICLLAGFGASIILPWLTNLLLPLGRITAWLLLGLAISVAALRDLGFARERLLEPQLPDLALRPVLGLPPLPLPSGYPQ